MSRKIFVDTNPLIYLVNGQQPYYGKVCSFFTQAIHNSDDFVTSTITDAEFLVKPLAGGNYQQIEQYKSFLEKLHFTKYHVTETIAFKAANLRANHRGIKLADALQVAICLESNCDFFLSNDLQLKNIPEISLISLDDL